MKRAVLLMLMFFVSSSAKAQDWESEIARKIMREIRDSEAPRPAYGKPAPIPYDLSVMARTKTMEELPLTDPLLKYWKWGKRTRKDLDKNVFSYRNQDFN